MYLIINKPMPYSNLDMNIVRVNSVRCGSCKYDMALMVESPCLALYARFFTAFAKSQRSRFMPTVFAGLGRHIFSCDVCHFLLRALESFFPFFFGFITVS